MAILRGHTDILKMLIKRAGPASLTSPDNQGFTPVHYAAWNNDLKAMKILSIWSTFKEALNLEDIWGRTPLMLAASKVCSLNNYPKYIKPASNLIREIQFYVSSW